MKLKTSLAVLVFLVGSICLPAQILPEKKAEIDKMLKLTGMEKLMDQMLVQLTDSLRTNMKEVPPEFWDHFASEVHSSELIDQIIPLYDKYYSLEDLHAINAFYGSPAGQRILSTMPQIMKESMAIGQEWGAKVAKQAIEEAKAEIEARKATKQPSA